MESKRLFQLLFGISIYITTSSSQNPCNSPFTPMANDGCFYFPDSSLLLSWPDAKIYCEQLGGFLAIADSAQVSSDLYRTMQQHEYGQSWLGLTNKNHPKKWIWDATGKVADYADFYYGTSQQGDGHCAALSTRGAWFNYKCTAEYSVICQQQPTECPAATAKCEAPFVQLGDGCYLFAGDVKSDWIGAKEYCNQQGAVFAVLDSEDEDSTVGQYIVQNFPVNSTFWIALYDKYQSSWYWNGNGEEASYTNWGSGYPTTDSTDYCAAAITDGTNYYWKDEKCYNIKFSPLCEIPTKCL